jgi:hypothetical protein
MYTWYTWYLVFVILYRTPSPDLNIELFKTETG